MYSTFTKGLFLMIAFSFAATLSGQSQELDKTQGNSVATRLKSQHLAGKSVDQPVSCPVHAGFSIAQYPLCQGNSLQLINASWNSTDYQWFINGNPFSMDEHPSLLLDKPGFHNILLVSSSSLCSDSAFLLVEVFESYSVQVFDTICHGDIYWFLQTPCQVTGTFSFPCYTAKGCDSTVILNLFVEPADASFVISGDSGVALTTGQWYQWCECSSILINIPGAIGPVFKPASSGFYTLIAGTEVCADTAGCAFFALTGVDQPDQQRKVTAFPVPATETLSLRGLQESGTYLAEVSNLAGKVLLTSFVSYFSPVIDIRELAAGSYVLRITERGKGQTNILFTVQRQ
jgi:hypothetical protein